MEQRYLDGFREHMAILPASYSAKLPPVAHHRRHIPNGLTDSPMICSLIPQPLSPMDMRDTVVHSSTVLIFKLGNPVCSRHIASIFRFSSTTCLSGPTRQCLKDSARLKSRRLREDSQAQLHRLYVPVRPKWPTGVRPSLTNPISTFSKLIRFDQSV